MRALIQRVDNASVSSDGKIQGEIGHGLLILLGVSSDDTNKDVDWIANKSIHLRIFEDEYGKMNLDVKAVGGEIMVVSQFTLYGNCMKGNRPSFTQVALPEKAEKLYRRFIEHIKEENIPVAEGLFGAHMSVSLTNNGPVTLLVHTPEQNYIN